MTIEERTDDQDLVDEGDQRVREDRPPDESTLLGHTGVQAEIEAEAARAEAEVLGEEGGGTADQAEV